MNMPSENVLFSRSSENGEWDDRKLIESYDRAVASVKAMVAERIGISAEEVPSASESCSSTAQNNKATPKGKKKTRKPRKKKNRQQIREWVIGDHCQAQYSDGVWYEATIIGLNQETGKFKVQYVGYGNEDDVPITSLKHSMGVAVRREQQNTASLDQGMDVESEREEASCGSVSSQHSPGKKPPQHSSFTTNGIGGMTGGTPPRPTFPTMPLFPPASGTPLFQDMVAPPPPPHVLANLPTEEAEALSAMLMSWYMSGFHTGYFQGLKRSNNFRMSRHPQ